MSAHQKTHLLRHLTTVSLWLGVGLCVTLLASAISRSVSTRTTEAIYRLAQCGGEAGPDKLARTVELIRKRQLLLADKLSYQSFHVESRPPDRLLIRVRASKDPQPGLAWLTRQGRVEFRLLNSAPAPAGGNEAELPRGCELKLYRAWQYRLNPPRELQAVEKPFILQDEPALKLERFRRAEVHTAGLHQMAVVTLYFEQEDARAFGRFTALHAGRRMAMLLDGEIILPPTEIESAITEGSVQIKGYFFIPRLYKLAAVLNAGPLPCEMTKVTSL
ncbi:MAG: hypothetical protein J7M08_05565 [Planctomycetes bacterium]|nr:hypothetical protein [Planctomycetota bacterium]